MTHPLSSSASSLRARWCPSSGSFRLWFGMLVAANTNDAPVWALVALAIAVTADQAVLILPIVGELASTGWKMNRISLASRWSYDRDMDPLPKTTSLSESEMAMRRSRTCTKRPVWFPASGRVRQAAPLFLQ
jgi:hypothetical protein